KLPFAIMPQLFNTLVMASVSVKRLNDFLNAEELEDYVIHEEMTPDSVVVDIQNGFFSWGMEEEEDAVDPIQSLPTLFGINLQVKKGSLIAICGYSVTGKSSLLSAILGDMQLIQGSV